jgi:hypothetical protein
MPRLAVVYDMGAVTAGEIAVGLAPLGEVTFVVGDSEHTNEMLPLLRELGDVVPLAQPVRPGFDAVVTYSERMLAATADLAARLDLPFHDAKTVELLTDKPLQRERLALSGVDAVRHHELTGVGDWPAALARVPLPAVLKPARGEGSRDTILVTEESGGHAAVASWFACHDGPLTLEEYLPGRGEGSFGDYVSVEGAVLDGAVSTIAVTGKYPLLPPFRERGHFWPSHLSLAEQDRIADLAADAVRALGVRTGLTHTEIKLTEAGPRLIEVNGRLGGFINELSRRATGQDLVTLGGRLALGEHVEPDRVNLERVVFQYHNLAPVTACTLDRIDGVRDVRAVDGVTLYQPQVRPGTRLTNGVMTQRLDFIGGITTDHAAMMTAVTAASAALAFTFTDLGESAHTWRVTGTELASGRH